MAQKLLSLNNNATSISFNHDCSQLAVGMSDNTCPIYKFSPPNNWTRVAVLSNHTGRVTSVDWAKNSSKIVTVSSDRNAYVWSDSNNQGNWTPELVLLRISRAATCVRWSPLENKFAVGSSARLATVCYWEKGQNCWVSKHIKKPIRSTIMCVDWHPENALLATGSSDMTCRIFSAYVKDIESKPAETGWGKKMPFGQLMVEYKTSGWVQTVSFSSTGNELAIGSHDSTTNIAFAGYQQMMICYGKHLPFTCLEWIAPNQVIAVGHDRCPYLFQLQGQELICLGRCFGKQNAGSSQQTNAMRAFQQLDLANRNAAEELDTVHVAPICGMRISNGIKANVSSFVTCGGDGLVYMWHVDKVRGDIQEV